MKPSNAAIDKTVEHVSKKIMKEDPKSQNNKNADIELILKEFDVLETVGRPRAVSDMLPTFQAWLKKNQREFPDDDRDVLVTPKSNKKTIHIIKNTATLGHPIV